ncbi:MAG TPA: hypothetical protein DD668_02120 [Alphaproteobacteria bacterium]|nr:hypothetical protein [Alphaproteobacteria bacterium]
MNSATKVTQAATTPIRIRVSRRRKMAADTTTGASSNTTKGFNSPPVKNSSAVSCNTSRFSARKLWSGWSGVMMVRRDCQTFIAAASPMTNNAPAMGISSSRMKKVNSKAASWPASASQRMFRIRRASMGRGVRP